MFFQFDPAVQELPKSVADSPQSSHTHGCCRSNAPDIEPHDDQPVCDGQPVTGSCKQAN